MNAFFMHFPQFSGLIYVIFKQSLILCSNVITSKVFKTKLATIKFMKLATHSTATTAGWEFNIHS